MCCQTPFQSSWRGESVRDNSLCFLMQGTEGIWKPVVERIRRTIGDSTIEVLLPPPGAKSPKRPGSVIRIHRMLQQWYQSFSLGLIIQPSTSAVIKCIDHKRSTKNSVERPDQRPPGRSTEIYELF
ncbi:hypothetical protein F511_19429 [Dorcoceras hygrometricum]|uniref:Uncharacterized protein n=1 Tax=Dorcoceras hygrometricum TaxID=472368 RepID=A0A2Z7CSA7_9LAMI|nr:hypothetical protein F511_19429 [Dorcoceras hygrometricum]